MAKLEPSDRDRQQAYYEETAHRYSALHETGGSAHDKALDFIATLLPGIGAQSLLDVGAGTGRAIRHLRQRLPDLKLRGIEPVPAMVREAERAGLPVGQIIVGDGLNLPFDNASFDVVTTFGVLHHVREPAKVIQELTRVARKAVFISDGNRFGQGRPLARYAKLALGATGLWRAFDYVRTQGRGYHESEGDGLYYSYSVFDTLDALRSWVPRLLFLELENAPRKAGPWADPLSNASTLLVGAIKGE